jgi:putative DNA primase/helicase
MSEDFNNDENKNDQEGPKNDQGKEKTGKTYDDLLKEIRAVEPNYEPCSNIVDLRPRPNVSNLITFTLDDFRANVPEEMSFVFYPCLPQQGIAWVYAGTGIGKTLFTLNLAYSIAAGGNFLKYSCPKPRKVLYVDGEMPYNQIYQRVMQIVNIQGNLDFIENFRVLTPDKLIPFRVPKIDDEQGQSIYLDLFNKHESEVIIFDNLSMLSSFDENKSSSFKIIQDWLLYLRSIGKTIIIIHHAGKNGDYRGSSGMLDCADVAISLEPIKEDKLESENTFSGKKFTLKYKKARIFGGQEALPFEITLDAGLWNYRSIEQTELENIVERINMKMTQRDISKELLISLSKVNRLVSKARKLGMIKD